MASAFSAWTSVDTQAPLKFQANSAWTSVNTLAPSPESSSATSGWVSVSTTAPRFSPGEVVTLEVNPANGTVASVSLTGLVPAPTIYGSGRIRNFVAPICSEDTELTFSVTDTAAAVRTQKVIISAAVERVHFGGSWNYGYELVVEDRPKLPLVENVPGFERILNLTFPTDIPEGDFWNISSGSDRGLLDPASPGGAIYGGLFKTKQEGQATGEASGCLYSTIRTTSVVNNIFTIRLHHESGIPYGGAIKPLLPIVPDSARMLYGRYIYITRRTGNDAGWGSVWDLIEPNTWASGTGEYGHPEGNHLTSPLCSFIRDSDGQPNPNRGGHVLQKNAADFRAPSLLNDWHINEMRTQPGLMQLFSDGVCMWHDRTNPPYLPLGFLAQAGAPGSPAIGSEAKLECAGIAISRWVG